MTIQEIKQRLSIQKVLQYYNLKPDRNKRINCPFHNDKTPSMQVYAETNTVFCFSSNCKLNGKAIDQIDFIMHKENCTKHRAINKAKELINPGYPPKVGQVAPNKIKPKPMNINNTENLSRIAVLTKLMYEAKASMSRSKKAQEYCKQRCLDNNTLEIGYLGDRFYGAWNQKLKQSAIETGLLKQNTNGSLSPAFRNCIIFPLKNKQGQVIDIYGRSVSNNSTSTSSVQAKHFYLKGKHQGIYPNYPKLETKTLIITESIIDSATLLQIPKLLTFNFQLLTLYGTNGLTEEHTEAIKNLPELKEIIFMLDADQAGHKAVERYSKELKAIKENVKISKIELPCKDVNETFTAHEPEIFTHLLNERTFLFSTDFSNENKNEQAGTASPSAPATQNYTSLLAVSGAELNTANSDKIIYLPDRQAGDSSLLKIEIWGGIEYHNMHRLRLSLYLENKATNRSFRDDVNLYSNRSSKAFLQDASEELEIPMSELKEIINQFTRKVEEYRLKQKEKMKNINKKEIVKLSLQQQKEAMQILKSQNLVNHLKAAMLKVGLIGETENGLLLFLIFLTRYFNTPLHALVHGSTGSGKTNLLKSILKLVPGESKYETTALTENVLFRPPYKDFWKNKILLIEDLDGSYKALLPLREFMTNQYISKLANDPNPKTGKYEQVTLEAEGPIVIAGATTRDKVYEDNSNRSFLLHVNESKTHEEKVLDYQNKEAAGLIDAEGIQTTAKKIQDIQRMLTPNIKVINPFQPQLKLPEYVFTKKRTNTHYIALIKSITFLFQYQREKKKDDKGRIYIETTLQDVALANQLSKESLLRKSDELSGQVREFFERLKATVKQEKKETFLAKDIRGKLRMHPMKFSRYINELRNRGYVKKVGGKERGSYEYQIIIWDDYQILKKGLTIMDKILEELYKQYPDGTYQKRK